jgi:5-methyltetrahydrofolate--homocysteine methyltransferase
LSERGKSLPLLELFENQEIILLDGAMGTQLGKYGIEPGGQNNILNPEKVLEVHKQYSNCGCDILITNTLTMNRIYIETHKLDVDVAKVNTAGVTLAIAAKNEVQYVIGDMSSTGKMLHPYGEYSESDFFAVFKEQALVLAQSGVDGFIIETMFDLREALCALRACKAIGSLPVLVSMAFSTIENGGRTMMGNSVEECVRTLSKEKADVVGVNCGDLNPMQLSTIVTKMREHTNIPILAQPNAGRPKLVDNETVFDMGPKDFAVGVVKCVENGARFVGGCCGTTPEHITQIKRELERQLLITN